MTASAVVPEVAINVAKSVIGWGYRDSRVAYIVNGLGMVGIGSFFAKRAYDKYQEAPKRSYVAVGGVALAYAAIGACCVAKGIFDCMCPNQNEAPLAPISLEEPPLSSNTANVTLNDPPPTPEPPMDGCKEKWVEVIKLLKGCPAASDMMDQVHKKITRPSVYCEEPSLDSLSPIGLQLPAIPANINIDGLTPEELSSLLVETKISMHPSTPRRALAQLIMNLYAKLMRVREAAKLEQGRCGNSTEVPEEMQAEYMTKVRETYVKAVTAFAYETQKVARKVLQQCLHGVSGFMRYPRPLGNVAYVIRSYMNRQAFMKHLGYDGEIARIGATWKLTCDPAVQEYQKPTDMYGNDLLSNGLEYQDVTVLLSSD